MASKKVAIIGAGTSGLVSVKYALENGLEPTVFEEKDTVGGLWSRKNPTAIWHGLYSNISKYAMMFHDHPWPNNSPIFNSAEDVHQYLINYSKKFNLTQHIRFKTRVQRVKQLSNKKWELNIFNLIDNTTRTEVFEFLIIASGLHCKPRIPLFKNSNLFNGIQIHSSQFQLNDARFKDKNVIVLGCSVSGAEIAASLVEHARSVTNIFNRAYLITPRLVKYQLPSNDTIKCNIVPIDLFLHRRCTNYPDPNLSQEEIVNKKIEMLENIFPYQTNKEISHPDLYVDLRSKRDQEILISVSDYYIKYVTQGKIKPVKSKIKEFTSNSVLLENGLEEKCDAIIYSTGYDLVNNYFEQSVMNTLKYDNRDHKFPLILYECTFHPDLENFAMVGQTEGIYFIGDELQANWATRVFSQKISLPNKELMFKEMNETEKRRNENRKSQFPYGFNTILADRIAKASFKYPNMEDIKKKDENLHQILWNSPVICNHFFIDENKSFDLINEVSEITNRIYEFKKNADDIDVTKMAKEFSNFYKLPDGLFKCSNE